jgi:hypothetical protein
MLHFATAGRFLDDLFAPCRRTGVPLKLQVPLRRRNLRIADPYPRPRCRRVKKPTAAHRNLTLILHRVPLLQQAKDIASASGNEPPVKKSQVFFTYTGAYDPALRVACEANQQPAGVRISSR